MTFCRFLSAGLWCQSLYMASCRVPQVQIQMGIQNFRFQITTWVTILAPVLADIVCRSV
jgi:hydroxylamine reductase (hybrid-cluster protein)